MFQKYVDFSLVLCYFIILFQTLVVFSIVQFKYFLCCCTKTSGLKLATFGLLHHAKSRGRTPWFNAKCFGFSICFYPLFRWVNLSNFNGFNLFGNAVDTEVLCWFFFWSTLTTAKKSQRCRRIATTRMRRERPWTLPPRRAPKMWRLCFQPGSFVSGWRKVNVLFWCLGGWFGHLFSILSSCKRFVCKHRTCDNEVLV